nr:hypothetical protein SHINE37_41153 [Rhizobiaceae bacterium]
MTDEADALASLFVTSARVRKTETHGKLLAVDDCIFNAKSSHRRRKHSRWRTLKRKCQILIQKFAAECTKFRSFK